MVTLGRLPDELRQIGELEALEADRHCRLPLDDT